MSIANLIKCVGLVSFGSELSFPEGSLRQALNVNIDENGVITPRRGFNDYSTPTTGIENVTKITSQLMEYKNSIIRQFDTSLEYEDTNNIFQTINGTFTPLRAGYRTKSQESNANLYFTSDEGIKKISAIDQTSLNADMISDAGGIKAGYSEGLIVPQIGGFLPPQSKVAYRVVYGTRDNNNNLIYGAPSSRFLITNFAEDQITYESSKITFDTGVGGAVADGDYVIFYSGTNKYAAYYDVSGSTTEPKTADTIGATYIKISATGITLDDASLAAVTANEIASSVSNITVSLDTITVIITQDNEGDITSISGGFDSGGVSIATRITTSTATNGNTVSGVDAITQITSIIPKEITTDYFYQVYRTSVISVVTGLTLNDIDPGDEMNLVYEAGITTSELTAGKFVIEDTTPESFRASALPLYTNEASGEGILQANATPPIALDLELFKNYMFYGNTKQRHQLEYTVVSVDNFISGSTKFIIGNEDISRYYTFTGTAEVIDIDIDSVPSAGDYINLYSANDNRQYYIYFGDSANDPEIAGSVGYRVDITGSPTISDIATRIESALIDNVDFNLSVASNVVTFTYTNNGYTTGITNGVGSSITINLPSTLGTGESTGTNEGGDVLLSGLISVGQAIDETARSLVKVISSDPDSPVNAYYLSTGEELPGNILLESRSLADKNFYISIEEPTDPAIGDEFTPEIPYSKKIAQFDESLTDNTYTTITLNSHGYSNGDKIFVGYFKDPSIPADPASFSNVYTIANVTTNTFDILVPNIGVVAFVPASSTIFTPDVESDNEILKNRLYYSKYKQPESVPRINFIDIGPQDSEILRILALRDELYVLKEDGIYVVSGTSAPDWSVRLVDSASLLAADSAVVLNNQIYCLTDQGITRVSGASAAVISRGIENKINNIVDSKFDYSSNTFGVAYENDRAYMLFTPQISSDTSSTQAYRYNIFEQTWSRWEYPATCGLVMKRDNKLYVGNSDRNYISQERKNNDRTDYSDRNFTTAVNTDGVTGTTVELSSLSDVKVNDVLLQTQDVSIYYINWKLLKKMDIFDTGVTSPVGSTMYDTYKVSDGDNLATSMQSINDYLRTLDPTYITAKSFTLSNLSVNTKLLVSELNTTGSLSTLRTYKDPIQVVYEAYIVSIDSLRNQVTIHESRPFVQGAINLYKGYTCTVEWNPLHFGNPAALKQISYMTIMFDQNNFSEAVAKFYSDVSQGAVEVPFNGKGIGYWGATWDGSTEYWGGNGNDIPSRRPVPYSKQKCRYISIAFEHNIAREKFRVIGVSGSVRQISDRAYGKMK